MNHAEFPPIIELIPHRDEILLLERVLEHDAESTLVRVDAGAQRWLKREDGSIASWLAIEYMAQCIAAHEGLVAREEGRSLPLGFLVAANAVRFHTKRIEPSASLRVRSTRLRGRPGLGVLSHHCSVHVDAGGGDGAVLAEGRLTISVPKNQPT